MDSPNWTAFSGLETIASGSPRQVVTALKDLQRRGGDAASVLIFNDDTGQRIELDLRGSAGDVLQHIAESPAAETPHDGSAKARTPGRPKLGVVAREVTLLPRHWEWLATQRGGASVALRKLVDEARRGGGESDRLRLAQDHAYRFMRAVAGDLAGFEEASRALFAADGARFTAHIQSWPAGVRSYAEKLAARALSG